MPMLAPSFRAAGLALLLASLPGLAAPTWAQRSPEDARTIDSYRLTMPVLRKVLPAMYARGAQDCDRSGRTEPSKMSLSELSQRLEQCAPVLRALQQAGVKPRDAAVFYAALMRAGEQMARYGGKVSAIPAGVIRDNAILIEQNDAEIRRLTEGDRS